MIRPFAMPFSIALLVGACGGKVPALYDPTVGPDGGHADPVPTCGAICAHIVGSCAPGANTDACVTDCEATRGRFATSCTFQLDDYLRCMVAARVECNPMKVVIVDCSDERNSLDACRP